MSIQSNRIGGSGDGLKSVTARISKNGGSVHLELEKSFNVGPASEDVDTTFTAKKILGLGILSAPLLSKDGTVKIERTEARKLKMTVTVFGLEYFPVFYRPYFRKAAKRAGQT